MEDELKQLKQSMIQTTFRNFSFNEKMKQLVRNKMQTNQKPKKYYFTPLLSVLVTSAVFLLLIGFAASQNDLFSNQGTSPATLNTSKLEPINDDDIPDEMKQALPIDYVAPSTKIALESIPFNVSLPKDPPFKVTKLQDVKRDGKIVRIEFTSVTADKQLTILATNQKTEVSSQGESIELNKGVNGYFSGSLFFENNGVYYIIDSLPIGEFSIEETKAQLIKIANQML